LKGAAGLLHGSASTDGKGVKLEGSVAHANGEVKFGATGAQGTLDIIKGTLNVPFNHDPITGSAKPIEYSGSPSAGPFTLDNSLNLGLSANVSVLNVEGDVNLYRVDTTLMSTGPGN